MDQSNRSPIYLVGLLFISCGLGGAATDMTNGMADSAVERVVREVTITSGEPISTADLRITGMSCEMMCGGSIKKALAKLPGVASTEIVFHEGDEADHAIVTYDPDLVSDATLINAVHQLHHGQYKVLAVTITNQVKPDAVSRKESVRGPDVSGLNVYAPAALLLPGVFTLLTRILRH